jgi:hypothetical protein
VFLDIHKTRDTPQSFYQDTLFIVDPPMRTRLHKQLLAPVAYVPNAATSALLAHWNGEPIQKRFWTFSRIRPHYVEGSGIEGGEGG